ncbi:hypothetical protein ACO0M4_18250 [Streptomyces sp. RGM 3693]|uniref:hypothetical protein n=1 Tax=Streptomyces sp. RGM 3693 TaxID=3413284 RepID=UPI003D2A8199
MIRIVTRARLAALEQAVESARTRAQSFGCPADKWGPATNKPATADPWRTVSLSRFAVEDSGDAG